MMADGNVVRRPRILFVGFPESSHTTSWIELLRDTEFDARLFALPSGPVASDFPFVAHTTWPGQQPGAAHDRIPALRASSELATLCRQGLLQLLNRRQGPLRWLAALGLRRFVAGNGVDVYEQALAELILQWQPDIVHTLGFDNASYLYARTREHFRDSRRPRWVAQARGGPDLDLYPHLPSRRREIEQVLRECDHFICDSAQNYAFALANGLAERKLNPGVGVVSGPGGLDVDALRSRWSLPPSRRERVIVWPKAYEVMSSKALPVFEALNLAWNDIKPCRIECLWLVQDEVRIWFDKMLAPAVKAACRISERVPQPVVLEHLLGARVMMAPSLTDGVPNAMMEAMACGAFPLVSPLPTITPVVAEPVNVLFARNLYPQEIAAALVRAMNDDALVDAAAERNVAHVRAFADRGDAQRRVLGFYRTLAAGVNKHSDRA